MKEQLKKLAWPWGAVLAALGVGGYEGAYRGGELAMDRVCNAVAHRVATDVSKPIARFSDTLIKYETGEGQMVWLTVGESKQRIEEQRRLLSLVDELRQWAAEEERGELLTKLAELGI